MQFNHSFRLLLLQPEPPWVIDYTHIFYPLQKVMDTSWQRPEDVEVIGMFGE